MQEEKVIEKIIHYESLILIVDDLFSLNFKDASLIHAFTHYKIREFSPSLRNDLICRWEDLNSQRNQDEQVVYKHIDYTTEIVNSALGKLNGSGVVPAYPFFILTLISTYNTFDRPLAQEITSQGHCYQALIILYLKNEGVNPPKPAKTSA